MDIININVGQTGINVGNCFLKILAQQHQLDSIPKGHTSTFFTKTTDGFVPRSICLDMDQTYPSYSHKQHPQSIKPENVLCDNQHSLGVYGQSRYNVSHSFKENLTDRIRCELELSGKIGGFLTIASLGGGTGSGLTSLVLSTFREVYPSYICQTFRLMPLINKFCHPIEIYNTAFAFHHQIQFSDLTLLFDNAALTRMLTLQGKLQTNIQAMNDKIGKAIANSTVPFSFSGDLNTSQRKLASNLVLFPRLHFLGFSQSKYGGQHMLSSALNQDNFFYSSYFSKNPSLPLFNIYAGVRSHLASEIDLVDNLKKEVQRKNYDFISWLPDNIHLSIHQPIERQEATLFINSYHTLQTFKNICEQFTASFRRKAFVHHYTACGMDQIEFTEAESNLNDLQWEYRPSGGIAGDDDNDYYYDQDGEDGSQG